MRLSRVSSTQCQKWPLSEVEEVGPTEETPVEGAAVEVAAVVAVVAVAVVKTEAKIKTIKLKRPETVDTRVPDTLTSRQESGPDVESITETEKMHTSVRNQPHVRGRIFLNQEIEKLTSSAKT